MNGVFHYYSLSFLALRAGFSDRDTEILAYSSTYPDHNLIPMSIETRSGQYQTIPTHHFGFWDPSLEEAVWLPFHFVPGGDSSMPAGTDTVVPNAEPVKEILLSALRSRDLYRVGIALHSFADSWAHQNFSGRNATANVVEPNSPIPPIGHAHAGRSPDVWNTLWLDPRQDVPVVDNRRRFLEAARKIYRYLCTYNGRKFADEELVLMELEGFLGTRMPGDLSLAKQQMEAEFHKSDVGGIVGTGFRNLVRKLREAGNQLGKDLGLRSSLPKPLVLGRRDEEIVLEIRSQVGVPEYNRLAWRNAALTQRARAQLFEMSDSTSETFLWLRNEVLHRSRLLKPQTFVGVRNFEDTDYYRWMEAAKAQARAAAIVLKNM